MRAVADVVAVLLWNGDRSRFLIACRPAHKARGGLWEFVGGKTEPGETRPEALRRECREELGVEITVEELFCQVEHTYPDLTVHLSLYHGSLPDGQIPQRLEHQALAWITPADIPQFDFCPADESILQKIVAQFG